MTMCVPVNQWALPPLTRQADSRNYTCTWSQDKETGKPYLCLSGEDAKIKIYDVTEGTLVNVGCFPESILTMQN